MITLSSIITTALALAMTAASMWWMGFTYGQQHPEKWNGPGRKEG